jgi:hypothetical protein
LSIHTLSPVISENKRPIRGEIKNIKKIRNKGNNIKLLRYIKTLTESRLGGRNAIRSQCPSNGGIGNILNIPNTKFNITIIENSSGTKGEVKISAPRRSVRPKRRAKIKLEMGPARATFTGPYFRSLKLLGLYGTGFA